MTATKRTRRPMIEMTGTVADLRKGDYVDTLGGDGWKKINVSAIIHAIEHVPTEHKITDLARLIPGTRDVAYTVREHAVIEFLGKGTHNMKPAAPATFRRFADQ